MTKEVKAECTNRGSDDLMKKCIAINTVKVLEDSDYEFIKSLCDNHLDWKGVYDKKSTKVWTRPMPNSQLHMIKVKTVMPDVHPSVAYDVLHDPDYRPKWDRYVVSSKNIGLINPNNDICYYAVGGIPPFKSRDFVLQRSWLDIGHEKYIFSHSICHESYPPAKGMIRGTVYLTAYHIKELTKGCQITYVNYSDPKGKLPLWMINRLTKVIGPKLIKRLHKAALGYVTWKANNKPNWKPWVFAEQQVDMHRVQLSECVPHDYDDEDSNESIDDETGAIISNQNELSSDDGE